MSEVAYSERDHEAIGKRKRKNTIYEGLTKGVRRVTGREKKQIKTIGVYPAIDNYEELGDVLNRIAFAFPYKPNLKISVSIVAALSETDIKKLPVPSAQKKYIKGPLPHIHLESNPNPVLAADAILIWKASAIKEFSIARRITKTYIIDKHYYSAIESSVLRELYYHCFSAAEQQQFEKDSVERFNTVMQKHQNAEKGYCFATGPSFDRYNEFTYEQDSFKLICNSAVKNLDFLNYIGKPDMLVFADPVFHFSPCRYSATFREEVKKAFDLKDFHISIPLKAYPLLLAHFPEYKDRLIGMPHLKGQGYNIPLPDNFWVKSSGNILTYLMLPITSAIAKKMYIIGADGREKSEKYFWKHSKTAQFGDLMQTAFDTHPSFFRDRDYEDYYDEHCQFLEELIQFGESQGKQYFSLTPSFIPALEQRPVKN